MGRKKREFITDGDGFVNVYTDGCCLNPDRQLSVSGFGIYWGPANSCKVYGPCKRHAKNDVAEMQGAYLSVKYAKQLEVTKLCINTASKLVFDAASYLLDDRLENEWLSLYAEQSTADREYYKKFKEAVCGNPEMKIKFNYLMPCSGGQHHDEAKRLAEKGAELHCNYSKLEVLNLNFNCLSLN